MQLKNLNNLLNTWGKYVVQQSRTYLSKSRKNNTKKLYDSLDYEILTSDKFVSLTFLMEQYGMYVDQGVKGANPNIIDEWTKGRRKGIQKAPNSPFSYKTKYPPSQPLSEWAKSRNFRLRDEKGRFTKGNYKSIGYVLSKFIYAQGIAPSLFFTKAYNNSIKRYADELANSLGDDFITNLR